MSPRPLLRALMAGLVGCGAVFASAAPAGAHAELLSTEPGYGATLPSGPDRVLLRYGVAVEVSGARATLQRSGKRVPVDKPVYATPDRKTASVPFRQLEPGSYLLTWFLFASDGDVMGGELAFTIDPTLGASPAGDVPAVGSPPAAGRISPTRDPVPARSTGAASPTPGPPCSIMASAPGPGSPCYVAPSTTQEPAPPPEPAPNEGLLGSPEPLLASAPPTGPGPAGVQAFVPLSQPQEAARWLGFASLVTFVGGLTFVAALWRAGAGLRRTRVLLRASLAGAILATVAALGLKGAALSGASAWNAFSPDAWSALNGTHAGRILVARLVCLALAVPVVAYLTRAPQRALRSSLWWISAAAAGGGAVVTHGLLSHAYARGALASVAHIVHLGAVAVWLGGLVMLTAVLLPRRRGEELLVVVPRFSRLAFASVSTAVVAGTVLLVLLSPRWTELPGSGYGRYLFVKLGLVAVLLAVASRARDFVGRRLPVLALTAPADPSDVETSAKVLVPLAVGAGTASPGCRAPATLRPRRTGPDISVDSVPLRPFVTAVTVEIGIAAGILAATALLVGRSVPT